MDIQLALLVVFLARNPRATRVEAGDVMGQSEGTDAFNGDIKTLVTSTNLHDHG